MVATGVSPLERGGAEGWRGLLVAARLLYLPGGLLFYALGVLLGKGRAAPTEIALGLVAVTLVHLITHYVNDAEDVLTDALTEQPTALTGGSRAIQRGLTTPARLLRASAWLAAVVVLLVVVEALRGELATAGLFAGMLVFGYSYSGRPLMLGRRGLGELTAAGVMGGLVPLAGAEAAGGATPALFATVGLLVVQTFFARLSTAYPDLDADVATRKWTLTALLGWRGSALAFAVAGVASGVVGVALGRDAPGALGRGVSGLVVGVAALALAVLAGAGVARRRAVVVPALGLAACGLGLAILLVTALVAGAA